MSVLEFYGLQQEPFSNVPVSHFYYESQQTKTALLRLHRAVDQMRGLAVVVGAIGAGKTTLARRLLDELSDQHCEAGLLVVVHSGSDPNWLLKRIAQQLGVENPKADKLELMGQLYQRLLEINESGKKAVVLIDEAQMLQTKEIMEEFRGMLNLELPDRKLVTFVFFGLPELDSRLHLDPPLLQRVAVKVKLDPMNYTSCVDYIQHRLKRAGSTATIFNEHALQTIYQYSCGSPRLINTIADNAIFEGALTQTLPIHGDIIERVAIDLGLQPGVPIQTTGDSLAAQEGQSEDQNQHQHAHVSAQVQQTPDKSLNQATAQSMPDPDNQQPFDSSSGGSLPDSPEHVSHQPLAQAALSSEQAFDQVSQQAPTFEENFDISSTDAPIQHQENTDESQFLREEDTELENVDDILSNLDEM